MQVGVPGGNQRNLKILGQPRSQDAWFARPGNVHNIGTESTQMLFEKLLMPYKRCIKREIFFDAKEIALPRGISSVVNSS